MLLALTSFFQYNCALIEHACHNQTLVHIKLSLHPVDGSLEQCPTLTDDPESTASQSSFPVYVLGVLVGVLVVAVISVSVVLVILIILLRKRGPHFILEIANFKV